jgi:predicted alpha/beta-fold hydrolase
VRRHLRWRLPSEDLVVEAGHGVRLLLRASWQPGPREDRRALLIVHGLGGSDASGYVVATGRLAFARGWHVVRMNMRGSGDGFSLCPLLYNAGLDTDLLSSLSALSSLVPRISVVGFSLGANLALLMLGRRRDRLPAALGGVAAVSPPLDLSACADALEDPRGRLYTPYFMGRLRAAYRRRQRRHPHLYEAGRERALRTVREFDDRITAPYGGYRDAEDYYARSSAGPWLRQVDRPVLVLSAEDDPMVPGESVRRYQVGGSGLVEHEMLPTGSCSLQIAAPGRFWAADRVLAWVQEKVA